MNIFILHQEPSKCSHLHADTHVVKMILETAQMLCSVHEPGQAPYKRTHYNHPCTVWSRTSAENYTWLLDLGDALCSEYTYRYGKRHKSQDVIDWCRLNRPDLPSTGLTEFAQAMPAELRHDSAVTAYRRLYRHKQESGVRLRYTRRPIPSFLRKAV